MNQSLFVGMSAPIRKTHAQLMDDATMAAEIDRVIEECVKSRLPVYIYVPVDVPAVPLDAERLKTPLKTEVVNADREAEDEVVKEALRGIKEASNPAIVADVLAARHGGGELTRKLVDLTGFQSYTTPLGKGIVDETSPYFNGLYNGIGKFIIFHIRHPSISHDALRNTF